MAENLKQILSGILTLDEKQNTKISGLIQSLSAETAARTAADSFISGQVDTISGDYIAADAYLSGVIDTLSTTAISVVGEESNAVSVTKDGTVNTVKLNINANDKFLSQTADGLSASFTLVKVTENLSSTIAAEYYIADKDGNQVGDRIQLAKDQFLKSATFVQGQGSGDDVLRFVFNTDEGTETTVDVPLSGLFDEYTAGAGIALTPTATGIEISGVIDATSETFLTVGANGFKLAGVQTAIDTTVAAASGALNDDIAFVSGGVDYVSGAVTTLNGTESTEGSVLYMIAQYDAQVADLQARIDAAENVLDNM